MARIKIRRDTAANWTSVNPILADGEIGYDKTNDLFKIGNGSDNWATLTAFKKTDNNYTTTEKNKLAALNEYDKGYFATEAALIAAHATGQNGWNAVVGETDTIWVWDSGTSAWVDTDKKGQVTSVNGQTGAVTIEGMTAQQIADLLKATVPDPIAFPSDGVISLDRTAGRPYNSYDMASGAKTITVAANPEENGYCYGSIISDATSIPDVTALTLWSGTYDNTNDVVNHYLICRKNGVNYIQWHQIA